MCVYIIYVCCISVVLQPYILCIYVHTMCYASVCSCAYVPLLDVCVGQCKIGQAGVEVRGATGHGWGVAKPSHLSMNKRIDT